MAAQQLNLADRLKVRENIVTRCTTIVANYALYLLNGTPTDAQEAWARGAIASAGSVGDAVSWHVLNQPDFLDTGSSISDVTLQGIVETAINAHFIVEP